MRSMPFWPASHCPCKSSAFQNASGVWKLTRRVSCPIIDVFTLNFNSCASLNRLTATEIYCLLGDLFFHTARIKSGGTVPSPSLHYLSSTSYTLSSSLPSSVDPFASEPSWLMLDSCFADKLACGFRFKRFNVSRIFFKPSFENALRDSCRTSG